MSFQVGIVGVGGTVFFQVGVCTPLRTPNSNTRRRCEICSKLTIKTPSVFIVNFEHILHLVLVFLLLTLSRQMLAGTLLSLHLFFPHSFVFEVEGIEL